MPLYYTDKSLDEEIQKGKRSRRASDFVEDKDVAAHNKKIAKQPKDKVTGKVVKPKKERKKKTKLVKPKTGAKTSGKFSKIGQKKVEAANARNAGRNILGTAGGTNTDPWGTQSRGAGRQSRVSGTTKIKKTLDNLQGQLQGMLAVLKTHKIDTSRGAFQSAIPDKDEKTRRRKDLKRQRNVGADKKVSEGMSYISEVKRSLDNQMKALIKSYKA